MDIADADFGRSISSRKPEWSLASLPCLLLFFPEDKQPLASTPPRCDLPSLRFSLLCFDFSLCLLLSLLFFDLRSDVELNATALKQAVFT